jgi:hypothetical protein
LREGRCVMERYIKHKCDDCVFIGAIDRFDAYCHQGRLIVLRDGDGSWNETTLCKRNSERPEFIKAVELAKAKGFDIENPKPIIVADECKKCGKRLVFSCRQIGTGYCHPCAHEKLALILAGTDQPREVSGEHGT